MKKIATAILVMFICNSLIAQSVGIGTATPDNSAMLDVSSNTKGILFPRMTKAQKSGISNPATGLLVFQNGPDSIGFYYYNGTAWLWLNGEEDKYWKANGDHIYNTNNQHVGIGTNNPAARLHVADSSVVFANGGFNAAPTPGNPPISGVGKRTMWYADKVAFRTGSVSGMQWDKDSIGAGSFAAGFNTLAIGVQAVAMGNATQARGSYTTSLGFGTKAMGFAATASGRDVIVNGDYSFGVGYLNNVNGYASTALGQQNNANAPFTTVTGYFNRAKSQSSFVTGSFNDTTNTNRLFEIGNGTADNNRKNAVTVINNGNTGIGTTNPTAKLHVADSSVVFSNGDFNAALTPAHPPVSGPGKRTMWYADKLAFRTGSVDGTQWDKDSIGNNSFAMGYNTIAKGLYSISMGNNNNAGDLASVCIGSNLKSIGEYSMTFGSLNSAFSNFSMAFGSGNTVSGAAATTIGHANIATGDFSMAIGNSLRVSGYGSAAFGANNTSSGFISTAAGYFNIARGNYSFVSGFNNIAKSPYSFVIGQFNDTTNVNRLFEIGNGTADNARNNAVTVITNGNTGIGTTTPAQKLDVAGTTATEGLVVGDGTLMTKIQSGIFTIGNNTGNGQTKIVTLTFPTAFAAPPKVFANAANEPAAAANDGFSVTIKSTTNTNCVLIITRTDNTVAWNQDLRLNWMAIQ